MCIVFRSSTSAQQDSYNNSSSSGSHHSAKQEVKNQPNNPPQNGKLQRVGSGRVVNPKKEIKDSDYRGFTKPRNYKTSNVEQKLPPKKAYTRNADFIQSQNFTNKNQQHKIHELEGEMSKLAVQEGSIKNGSKSNSQRQGSVPPRLQGEQKSSKRYSSLRQRSLPETAAPPFGQHPQNYYQNGKNKLQ